MNENRLVGLGILAAVIGMLGFSSLFIVDQRETTFVLQFGRMVKVETEPGLKFKIPFIQEVVRFDKRLQYIMLPEKEVTAGDQKRIVVDVFSRYVISDPIQFFKTVRNFSGAEARLDSIISRSLRRMIGQVNMVKLLSNDRVMIMDRIQKEVATAAKDLGVEVKDVRIVRANLPPENNLQIFDRMKSEREREAKLHIAEGEREAKQIRAKADLEVSVLLANAKKKAKILEGEGDAESADIFNVAIKQDLEFYTFYRTMQAYEKAMSGQTTFVLSRDNRFFKLF